ncbi:phosphatidylinositol-specific phospholipase C domain-containing protein [Aquimarina hainanensis]|uniref:1-phosphatidylinositol phosphodiesterase n=1 Tax=Aquimarina hainanensis TaxID=1578017 RepID=A0ABW5NB89_9FLAO
MLLKNKILWSVLLLFNTTIAQTGQTWMKYISDDTKISRITIPGTHDSGSVDGEEGTFSWVIPDDAKINQHETIMEQLYLGVRFLDIRLQDEKDKNPRIVHGTLVDFETRFKDVMKTIKSFLKQYPTETILLSIKKDDGSEEKLAKQVKDILNSDSYKDIISTKYSKSTTLKSVRGKVIILSRMSKLYIGKYIKIPDMAENESFGLGYVQDYYNVSKHNKGDHKNRENKWDLIYEMMHKSKDSENDDLYLNYTSGFQTNAKWPEIPTVYNYINEKLLSFMNYYKHDNKGFGVIVTDNINADLARAIYRTNFDGTPKQKENLILYQHVGYKGKDLVVKYGYNDLGDVNFSNRASSLKIKDGYEALLYYELDKKGAYISRRKNNSSIGNDFNDEIVSVTVRKIPEGVLFFKRKNYEDNTENGGQPYTFDDKKNNGKYSKTFRAEVGDDNLVSMRIPAGYKVTLYEDKNWKGSSRWYKAAGNKYYNVSDLSKVGWKDRTSSVKIEKIQYGKSKRQYEEHQSSSNSYLYTSDCSENCKDIDQLSPSSNITLSPNPAHNSCKLFVQVTQNKIAELQLFNLIGEIIYHKEIELYSGNNEILITIDPSWSKGMYIVKFKQENQIEQMVKLVIE